MPPRPLVDLSHLDLKRLAYGPDDIRKILPHRGAMALLDGVVLVDVGRCLAVGFKDARPDEFWTSGHFPGDPMMPGVVQVEAAGQLAVLLYKLAVPEIAGRLIVFGGLDSARFRGVVRPGDRLWLVAQGQEVNRRLARCAVQGIVDGRVVVEAVVLGIPVQAGEGGGSGRIE